MHAPSDSPPGRIRIQDQTLTTYGCRAQVPSVYSISTSPCHGGPDTIDIDIDILLDLRIPDLDDISIDAVFKRPKTPAQAQPRRIQTRSIAIGSSRYIEGSGTLVLVNLEL
jgi:hypothetical protein